MRARQKVRPTFVTTQSVSLTSNETDAGLPLRRISLRDYLWSVRGDLVILGPSDRRGKNPLPGLLRAPRASGGHRGLAIGATRCFRGRARCRGRRALRVSLQWRAPHGLRGGRVPAGVRRRSWWDRSNRTSKCCSRWLVVSPPTSRPGVRRWPWPTPSTRFWPVGWCCRGRRRCLWLSTSVPAVAV